MPPSSVEPFIVAVTGGIGSGKSTVSRLFTRWGAHRIDADELAHRAFDDPAVRAALAPDFPGVFGSGGEVDRAALADRVFTDPESRRRLEAVVHPWVRDRIEKELAALSRNGSDAASPLPGKRPLVLLDVPLLETSPFRDRADAVVFIDTPVEDRIRRVTETRGWSREELARREASQRPLAEKRRAAHHVLPNPDPESGARARGKDEDPRLVEACRALLGEWISRLT